MEAVKGVMMIAQEEEAAEEKKTKRMCTSKVALLKCALCVALSLMQWLVIIRDMLAVAAVCMSKYCSLSAWLQNCKH